MVKSRASDNFLDFRRLKVPSNPLEPAKCKFVTIDYFFTTRSAYSNILNVFTRKSRASENFFDFRGLKVPFKVTSHKSHFRGFRGSKSAILEVF